MDEDPKTHPRATACPICGKRSSPEHRPFCSQRCVTIDLARWIAGDYRVPTEEGPEQEEEGDD
jgi:uncharacterized protein